MKIVVAGLVMRVGVAGTKAQETNIPVPGLVQHLSLREEGDAHGSTSARSLVHSLQDIYSKKVAVTRPLSSASWLQSYSNLATVQVFERLVKDNIHVSDEERNLTAETKDS